ncbi:MAG: HAD-IA family hydrolase [Bacillota bacterium]|nr:HAD-IA family hydrolase [Bacillota bacterium]
MEKLITFDFEGTLVGFQWKLEQAQGEVLNLLVGKGISREIFVSTNYDAIYNLVQEKGEKWGFPAGYLTSLIDEIYDIYDLDAATRWQPVDKIHEVLKSLKGYRTALISNVGRKGLSKALVQHGLQDEFGLTITRNDMTRLKPADEGILKAINWAGVKKENTIHIGDSLSDLFAARNAGVKVGIVLGGQNTPEVLLREKPDLILYNLAELPSVLRAVNF